VPEFTAFPKIPRLRRDCIITEKIDGTNAAINIRPLAEVSHWDLDTGPLLFEPDQSQCVIVNDHVVSAQSRKRVITPELDNFGFAKWVANNATALTDTLGPGLHFGEWWGLGIQRGYGLDHKRFSLFNTTRWEHLRTNSPVEGLGVVPVLYEGPFEDAWVQGALDFLRQYGSAAVHELYGNNGAVGFGNPEGIIVYHTAANSMFKVTLENDEAPKSSLAQAA
jgi:hypothetical protein